MLSGSATLNICRTSEAVNQCASRRPASVASYELGTHSFADDWWDCRHVDSRSLCFD